MQQGLAARSVHRKISSLKSFFHYLIKNDQLQNDPFVKVVLPKAGKRLPVFVPENHMQQLFEDVDFGESFVAHRDRLILEMLYGTGMRRSEIVHLKDTDIDTGAAIVKVLGKGNKERHIPLGPHLIPVITTYQTVRDQEFPQNRNVAPYSHCKRQATLCQFNLQCRQKIPVTRYYP